MNKPELLKKVIARTGIPRGRTEAIFEAFFASLTQALAGGERIEIRGFGCFFSKQRRARAIRNPQTGKVASVNVKRLPYFRAGKELRVRVDGGYPGKTGKK